MAITISASEDTKKDVHYHAPISGDIQIIKTLNGVFQTTVVSATGPLVDAAGTSSSASILSPGCGITAAFYSDGYSGTGKIIASSSLLQGGESGVPYEQITKTFIGVHNE